MTAATANIPTRSEAQVLLAMLERMRAKLVMQRAEFARQFREVSNRVDGIDRQLDDLTVSAEWLSAVARHPSTRLPAGAVTRSTPSLCAAVTCAASFTSRRNLVARRFIRNRPAVVALVLLVLGFIGKLQFDDLTQADTNEEVHALGESIDLSAHDDVFMAFIRTEH